MQRVNIQYSVKIDELEGEVQRLATKAKEVLRSGMSKHTKTLSSVSLSIDSHSKVDSLRLSLSEADAILSDVSIIIGSFLSYKAQQLSQSVPTPHVPEGIPGDPSEATSELSEIRDKISNFKSKLSQIENGDDHEADIR
jgi:hypothetical protein